MTMTLRWVRLETWQRSGGRSGRSSAGEVFPDLWGFRIYVRLKLLPAPAGLVIEHVQISSPNLMRFNALGSCLSPLCRRTCRTKPQRQLMAGASQTLLMWPAWAGTSSDSYEVIGLSCCNQGEHALCLNTLWLHGRDGCFKCWFQYTSNFWSTESGGISQIFFS